MKVASSADVKAHFGAYLRASEHGPVVVTRNGKPAALLLAVSNEDDLERVMMAHSPRLQAILRAARQRIQAGGGVREDEFWRDMERLSERQARGRKRAKGAQP
jgi:prevent-host-death family protein